MINTISTNIHMTGEKGINISLEEKPTDGKAIGHFCGALSSCLQNIVSNYMALQSQIGFYGSTDKYGDP